MNVQVHSNCEKCFIYICIYKDEKRRGECVCVFCCRLLGNRICTAEFNENRDHHLGWISQWCDVRLGESLIRANDQVFSRGIRLRSRSLLKRRVPRLDRDSARAAHTYIYIHIATDLAEVYLLLSMHRFGTDGSSVSIRNGHFGFN